MTTRWTSKHNPRAHKTHVERGPKKFSFTYQDMADAKKVPLWKLKRHVYTKRFDPTDLTSVAKYLNEETRDT